MLIFFVDKDILLYLFILMEYMLIILKLVSSIRVKELVISVIGVIGWCLIYLYYLYYIFFKISFIGFFYGFI